MTIEMQTIGKQAKNAARQLRRFDSAAKNRALAAIAAALEEHSPAILAANTQDLEAGQANGISAALLDRLNLHGRLAGIVADVRKVITLPDPVGLEFDRRVLENGLKVVKRRVPIGVLGVIYESRPNVTVDVTVLALKTSNAVILRGGSETLNSNLALEKAIQAGLERAGFPALAVQLIADRDRRYVAELLKLQRYVDMIIPRGGNALHEFCRENSTIPVITGGIGICHLYVDESADFAAALEIIYNAKTQRPSVCNALDTLLVKRDIAPQFIPQVIERLAPAQVTFKLDPTLSAVIPPHPQLQPAHAEDWDREWLDLILGIKAVDGLDEAIEHIETHGTAHSDGILTQNPAAAEAFLNAVDSAAVYVNASTRFTDGAALGLGAEVAISTQKLHARGPMALEELTTYKWIIRGTGQVRP
jgi:glutamate-5-semialdehyde dehydrogenase